MITLENVKYEYIIDIKYLRIEKGKITVILGESGSGKTTLLKTLNRMLTPTTGSIEFNGKDIRQYDPVGIRRIIAMLPQNAHIFAGDIRHNLLIGLKYNNMEIPSDDELLAFLNEVGVFKGLDEDTSQLSGGEKQRLAFLRVILMKPEVILLDEPTSALDSETEEKLIKLIKHKVESENMTAVIVSHSKNLAKKCADVTVRMEGGQITDEINS